MNLLSTPPRIELLDRRPEHIRRAVSNDIPALTALIDRSMRELDTEGYSQRQITSSLLYLTQVDPRLITDGTYCVAEADGKIVGAGGWTRRALAHGVVRGEHAAGYEQWLESTFDTARILAVYVDPRWAGQGIGRRMVSLVERAAHHAGFNELALLASVGGVPLYQACGYTIRGQFDFILPDGTCVPAAPMSKRTHG